MAISENEKVFQSIFQGIPTGLILLSENGEAVLLNEAARKYFNASETEAGSVEKLPITSDKKLAAFINSILKNEHPAPAYINNEKGEVWVRGARINKYFLISLIEIEAEHIKERERHRIAMEIHDGIGPWLSTLVLFAEQLEKYILPNEEARQHFETVIELLNNVTKEVRQISHKLEDDDRGEKALLSELEEICRRLHETGRVIVTFSSDSLEGKISPAVAHELTMIGQELINNSLRHSGASEINVRIVGEEKLIKLTVEDNGKGMVKEKEGPGIGLKNILSRVEELKGSISFETPEDRGVTATVEIPIVA